MSTTVCDGKAGAERGLTAISAQTFGRPKARTIRVAGAAKIEIIRVPVHVRGTTPGNSWWSYCEGQNGSVCGDSKLISSRGVLSPLAGLCHDTENRERLAH